MHRDKERHEYSEYTISLYYDHYYLIHLIAGFSFLWSKNTRAGKEIGNNNDCTMDIHYN